MNPEDDHELWNLLGKASAPEVSPFFARNVLRQVRAETQARFNFREWLARWKLATAIGMAAAILLTSAAIHTLRNSRGHGLPAKPTVAVVHDDDFDSDINDLVAASDDNDDDDVVVL